jgi:hypothetical protein
MIIMKNILHYTKTGFLCLLLFSAMSCKKSFLEITPKGSLIAKTTNDYSGLLSNNDLLTGNGNAQIPMGDEVAAVDPFFTGSALRTQRLFRWDDVIYDPNQDSQEMGGPMKCIYNYNKVINEVMGSTGGTDQQKKSVQAEAMAGRAWTYFFMINYYGKPYTTTAATDAGYPIVTEADVTATSFKRASVQEVYDFIIHDLVTAIPNLPVQTTHRLRMSKAAAEAILGKVYVFMGKFDLALPLLNAAFADLAGATIPVRLYDYNVTFAPGGVFLPIGSLGPSAIFVGDQEENVYGKINGNSWAFTNNEIVITPQTVALFSASDLRLKYYFSVPYPSGSAYPSGMLRKTGSSAPNIGVALPELYLLRAECKARLNDLAGAKADVETLRFKRMSAADAPVPSATASSQPALVKYILDERIREFAVTGFRWFDMRRLSVDPAFSSTVNTTHILYSSTGTVLSSFTLRPERLVMRFPQKVMDQNPGMQNNQ